MLTVISKGFSNGLVFLNKKMKLNKNISILVIIFVLLVILLSDCSNYEKYYDYFSGRDRKIFYSKNLNNEYIQTLNNFIDKEIGLFYDCFVPGIQAAKIETVVLIDSTSENLTTNLLRSINKKSHVINFNQLGNRSLEYTYTVDIDGLNLSGTNFIFLKKSKYDSMESLADIYIIELSHILFYANSERSGIMRDNRYDYIDEFISNIFGLIYTPNMKECTFDRIRKKLDKYLIDVLPDGYPDKLKDPGDFQVEKINEYMEDFLCLFHLLIKDKPAYEKFKKTMFGLFTKQYNYAVDQNAIDRPFIDNYGKTFDELVASWSPDQM